MNKTKRILAIIILIILITTKCNAIAIIEGTSINIRRSIEVPYHYEDEEKSKYDLLVYNNNQIYALSKCDNLSNKTVTNGEKCNDLEIVTILDNAYPMQMHTTLGCADEIEAYIATQEAIYCKLENKDINKYVAENEAGQRIINAVRNILKKPQRERIRVEEASDWIDLSKTEKYKEYVMFCDDFIDGTIEVVEGNARVTDLNGQIINTMEDGGHFRLVVPKNKRMTVNIKLQAHRIGNYVQICSSTKDENIKYVMSEVDTITEHKEFEAKVQTVEVNILNEDDNYDVIANSSFDILDSEYNKIMENLRTDNFGKISLNLDKGKYYLKQTRVSSNYEINKAVLEIDIQDGNDTNINITNTKRYKEQVTKVQKEINVKEETKQIKENNIKEITNINTTNINREIVNEQNVTNLHNVNNFINTINRKNVLNLEKENIYRNVIEEIQGQNKILEGENHILNMTRSDYINHIDMLMHNNINVPILPVASK